MPPFALYVREGGSSAKHRGLSLAGILVGHLLIVDEHGPFWGFMQSSGGLSVGVAFFLCHDIISNDESSLGREN